MPRAVGRTANVVIVVAALAALAFQQSPGNESVRANAAFRVLQRTDDELSAALIVVALTMLIEGVTSILIALGLNLPNRWMATKLELFRSRLGKDEEEAEAGPQPESWPARLTDTGVTLSLGPGLVVVRRHFQQQTRTLRADLRTLFGYCVVGSVVSGIIAWLVVGGVAHADKVGLGTPARWFRDWAADWRFWVVLLTSGYLISWTHKAIRRRRAAPNRAESPTTPRDQASAM